MRQAFEVRGYYVAIVVNITEEIVKKHIWGQYNKSKKENALKLQKAIDVCNIFLLYA